MKLLCNNKHGRDGIINFQSLMMFNAELKISAKALANQLQVVFNYLMSPEETCVVMGRTIQGNHHMVCMIIEKVKEEAALINLNHSKAFDRVDHCFLEAVLSVAGFKLYFHSWICLLYVSPSTMVEDLSISSCPDSFIRVVHFCPCSICLRWNLSCAD